ncbi:MAG: CHAD domain-containing protein [Magnetococcales bacterium]|nr:CHAD domain-containing protein [Magnetococcales bacterium]
MAKKSSTKMVPEESADSTEAVFISILQQNFNELLKWEPVAQAGEDIEGVHQLRVILRRMRSAVIVFRKAIPRQATDTIGGEMRWAANELGAARDLDVFIDEGLKAMAGRIPLAAGETKMRELAWQHRQAAYQQVRAMIGSDRLHQFKESLPRWLEERPWRQMMPDDKASLQLRQNIKIYATRVLNSHLSHVLQTGEQLEKKSVEELHMLRIECKKLRYATEFFSSFYGRDGMGAFVSALRNLQATLGIMNDVSVMHHLLDHLLQGCTDQELVIYAGAIIGWRSRQYEEVRGRLPAQWEQFSRMALPWSKG